MTTHWRERITLDPKVLTGKPVVRGTRLSVEHIVNLLAEGWTEQEVLENYPGLVTDDVRACLAYAGELLRSERVFPIPA